MNRANRVIAMRNAATDGSVYFMRVSVWDVVYVSQGGHSLPPQSMHSTEQVILFFPTTAREARELQVNGFGSFFTDPVEMYAELLDAMGVHDNESPEKAIMEVRTSLRKYVDVTDENTLTNGFDWTNWDAVRVKMDNGHYKYHIKNLANIRMHYIIVNNPTALLEHNGMQVVSGRFPV